LNPTSAEYAFYSTAHGTFPQINHILGCKARLNKYKIIDLISSVLSDHNVIN
jgi:hypothetical protein